MPEPKFQWGSKVDYFGGSVIINSAALCWAEKESGGYVYLVKRADSSRPEPFLLHEEHMRKPERWEPCPGTHRVGGEPSTTYDSIMERLVE